MTPALDLHPEHMMPICDCDQSFIWNTCWTIGLARKLGVPILVMEHKRLGETIPEVKAAAADAPHVEIVTFSFIENPASRVRIEQSGRDQLIFLGNETHISIFQSAVDAAKEGYHPFVLAEGCAARDRDDHVAAVERLRQNRVEIVTREMVLFEWVRSSEDPIYRETSIEFLKHPHRFPRPEHLA